MWNPYAEKRMNQMRLVANRRLQERSRLMRLILEQRVRCKRGLMNLPARLFYTLKALVCVRMGKRGEIGLKEKTVEVCVVRSMHRLGWLEVTHCLIVPEGLFSGWRYDVVVCGNYNQP